jgi:hypothetical protein
VKDNEVTPIGTVNEPPPVKVLTKVLEVKKGIRGDVIAAPDSLER